jgi:deoxyribonuclease V
MFSVAKVQEQHDLSVLTASNHMAQYKQLHSWDMSPGEAVALQKELRDRVIVEPLHRKIETIAGADISFNKYSPTLYAGIVVLNVQTLEVIEEVGVVTQVTFPYLPGLLSFRETPPLLEAWSKLKSEPDAVMIDGHGLAHPRRFGIACHVGLLVDRPTLGCGKSVLVGKYQEPPPERGSWTPMLDKGEVVGAALRTKSKVSPIYVTVGHRIDLESAIALTLQCDGGYRQPEPTRRAHLLVNALRRGEREVK